MKPSISIILPSHNEEANIEKAIRSALATLERLTRQHEVIVVNDGSRDSTAEIVRRIGEETKAVRLINHERNLGYGAALRVGLRSALHDLIFFTDSDLQFDLEEFSHLLEWTDRYDIVAGYRRKRKDSLYRRFLGWGWTFLIRCLFGLRVKDIDCAFKIFRRKVIDSIPIDSVGAFINSEILIRAKTLGFSLKQIPVTHYPRSAGKPTGARPKVIWKAFSDLIRLYRELREERRQIQR